MRSELEIRNKLEEIRNLYETSCAESLEFAKIAQDRNQDNFWEKHQKQQERRRFESTWISEMALLEWILDEKPTWRTSWMAGT